MFYDNDHIRLVDYKRNNGGKWTPLMFINPSRDGLITNIDMDKKQDYINFNQVINLHEPIYYVINKKICDYYVEHINDDNIQIISDIILIDNNIFNDPNINTENYYLLIREWNQNKPMDYSKPWNIYPRYYRYHRNDHINHSELTEPFLIDTIFHKKMARMHNITSKLLLTNMSDQYVDDTIKYYQNKLDELITKYAIMPQYYNGRLITDVISLLVEQSTPTQQSKY